MKDLWGEGHHQAEMDDMMKQKAAMRNSKILSVLEVMKDKSLRPSLCIVFLLTSSMQWCGLSAVE